MPLMVAYRYAISGLALLAGLAGFNILMWSLLT